VRLRKRPRAAAICIGANALDRIVENLSGPRLLQKLEMICRMSGDAIAYAHQ
jgi:hypothetical protein